jgi:hypothetical protein
MFNKNNNSLLNNQEFYSQINNSQYNNSQHNNSNKIHKELFSSNKILINHKGKVIIVFLEIKSYKKKIDTFYKINIHLSYN